MPSVAIPYDLVESVHEILGRKRIAKPVRFTPVQGGRNNRVYRIDGAREPLFVKTYYSDPNDPRDRFGTERRFYALLQDEPLLDTPRVWGWDSIRRLGLFSYVDGRKLRVDEIGDGAVEAALGFVADLNKRRGTRAAGDLRNASEACFSVAEHLALVGRRVERVQEISGDTPASLQAREFIARRLTPIWEQTRRTALSRAREAGLDVDRELTTPERCISPSDFGFHNCISRPDGGLTFFDFEYSGWDDPAKLTCDFFCQPQLPVPASYWSGVVDRIASDVVSNPGFRARAALLLPVYQVKWCCIILNDFLIADSARRQFAEPALAGEEAKIRQLESAERLCRVVESAGL